MRFIPRHALILPFLLLLVIAPIIAAQEVCEPFTADLAQSLKDACSNLEAGFACTTEEAQMPLEGSEISAPALFKLPASDTSINALMLGNAVLNVVAAEAPQVTLNATNGKGYNVNLRSGPGSDFDQAGIFSYDDAAIADGRDSTGEWIRLQADEGTTWIAKSLVTLDGDAMTLPIVQAGESGGSSALTLELSTNSDEPCKTSGLLVSYESDKAAVIQINEVMLQLKAAIAFIQIQDEQIHITAVNGVVTILSAETPIEATAGETIFVSSEETEVQDAPYPFGMLVDLPLNLVTETPLACITGILEDTDEIISRTQPDEASDEAFILSAATHYLVDQQSEDSTWWRISNQDETAWVLQDAVQTVGDCEAIPTQNLVQATSAPVSALPTGDPADVIYGYLQARVEGDTSRMQTLSCATWDSQAVIQSQSFRAMSAELQDVVCTTTSQGNTSAVVTCSGRILTLYNNETREWALGSYSITAENGQWRMCGEA